MRRAYALVLYLATPLLAGWLLTRSLRDAAWAQGLGERLGFDAPVPHDGIWIHAASVGEIQAALPLVTALRARYPGRSMTLTAFTPSGRDHARRSLPDDVRCRLLPFDFPGATRRFVERVRPRVAIVIETELWPNLFAACARAGITVLVVSACLSERSAWRYRPARRLLAETLAIPTLISTQTQTDAARLLALGADPARVTVGGSLKFDLRVPDRVFQHASRLRAELGIGSRPVWIAASTHEGEDERVLEAHRAVTRAHADALLVLAPRHPARADAVAQMIAARDMRLARRSTGALCDAATSVYLLDTLGELVAFYGIADVAFVGGSLVPIGGHNLLEPAAFGLPLVTGPHLHGVTEVQERLAELAALEVVRDSGELGIAISRLLADANARHERGAAARRVLESNRGTLERMVELVRGVLE